MSRLSLYLSKLFAVQALALFGVVALLVWITQALRLFDLVTAKGQDLLTLLGQASLTTPPLARSLIYICMGIGMVRGLKALQASRELHTIHSSHGLKALWRAAAVFALGGVIAVSLVANWLEPASKRAFAASSEAVAADLLGRALNPNRFSEVVPGLVVVIGGRRADGTVTDFYADDTRDSTARRTYMAESAVIVLNDDGYNISLKNGSLQYQRDGGKFTEVAFSGYQLGLDRPDSISGSAVLEAKGTLTLIRDDLASGNGSLSTDAWWVIGQRLAEVSRVIAICLLAMAISGFPHARRSQNFFPAEVVILILGLGERALSSFTANSVITGHSTGSIVLGGLALIIIATKVLPYDFTLGRRQTA